MYHPGKRGKCIVMGKLENVLPGKTGKCLIRGKQQNISSRKNRKMSHLKKNWKISCLGKTGKYFDLGKQENVLTRKKNRKILPLEKINISYS